MAAVSVYTARCSREDDWWLVDVPELGHLTQVRRLAEVDSAVRSLVGLFTDDDPAEVSVETQLDIPEHVHADLKRAQDLRHAADEMHAEASRLTRDSAEELSAKGYSLRDIGLVVGVSYQRIQQLLQAG
jgi:hypothetical protein